jgi:Domian of unknown function (DUF4952)
MRQGFWRAIARIHRAFVALAIFGVLSLPAALHARPFDLSCMYIGHPPASEMLGPRKACARWVDGRLDVAPEMRNRLTYGKYGLGQLLVLGNGGGWRYVDKNGETLPVVTFDNGADYFAEGFTRGIVDGGIAYFDPDFHRVAGPYADGTPFRNGRAAVCQGCSKSDGTSRDGHWGFIDRTGKVVLPITMTQAQAAERAWPDEAPQCGDVLARYGMKPEHLDFVECHEGKDAQLRALIARYRTRGLYAAGVESQLTRDTGMEAQRYVCCGWEVVPAKGEAIGDGSLPIDAFSKVTMTSGETTVHSRKAWAEIPWFYVDVIVDLESP